jgi:medium-chain acyl-[acyl-carrier-protein] hydrolase
MKHSCWLIPVHHNEYAPVRLLCLPYAAGGASLYRFLAHVLPAGLLAHLNIWAVEYPGHGTRIGEAASQNFFSLLDALFPAVASFFEQETVLFGYSLGAMLGFEVARRVRDRMRVTPSALLVAACGAPQYPAASPFSPSARRTCLGQRDAEEVIRLRRTYHYVDAEPLACPITAFGGAQDEEVSEAALHRWREQTRDGFTCHLISAQHFFLRHPLFLHLLADSLHICVGEAQLLSGGSEGRCDHQAHQERYVRTGGSR